MFSIKEKLPLLICIQGILFLTLVFTTSCSRKALPDVSYQKSSITSKTLTPHTGNKRLNQFIASGTGKRLNTGKVSADDIIKSARKYMGTPHCMGGSSKKCMDCSGLVMQAFALNGITLPHNSEEQARYGKIIQDKNELRKGDLIFFINTYKTSKYITHAGICIGNNQFIHTSSSKGVTITSLDNSWWKDKFIFGTRVF
ncbi:C40 family peptidase [Plebeiibacterium sediminum]|uniref:C40 family peptidase n=1 Tax=Plebeiibacterium sediminum TaxID=2992112 RepID=A0AAE3SI04_9BACT|nr:C40 family peptidase [Plebeiobacterium sediminum]MCW3788673.1 C40 family peptidase [Plebeiobacterium sediminum]